MRICGHLSQSALNRLQGRLKFPGLICYACLMKRIWARVLALAGWGLVALVVTLPAFTGCVTKAEAKAQARAAYLAGQQEAMTRAQQAQGDGGNVRINGQVQIPILPWVKGLTLMKALVTSEYSGPEPTQIMIMHNGIANRVDVKKLLAGEDVPLQPGDVVQIGDPQAGSLTTPLHP